MQTNQNGTVIFHILSQAIAYLIGGIFLWASSSSITGGIALVSKVFGGVFIGLAFILVISSFLDRLIPWAKRMNKWLFFALFVVAMARLTIMAVESEELRAVWIVIAVLFLLLILISLVLNMIRIRIDLGASLGTGRASVRILRLISVVLSIFALSMVVLQVNILGGPIIYLAISVFCLSIASLERNQEAK